MGYFDIGNDSDGKIRNEAFQVVNGVREVVSMALRRNQAITYESAIQIIRDYDPELYKDIRKVLPQKNKSDTVKLYEEMAEAVSTEERLVSPTELIDQEITKTERLIELAEDGKKRFLRSKLFDLMAAKEHFMPRELSENRILNHDYSLAQRSFLSEKLYENDYFVDYSLKDNRVLRMRLLHPDKEEHVLGVDLIYEQFDLLKERVRFVHLQYKILEKEGIYFSSGNLDAQLAKMEKHLCSSGYCANSDGNKNSKKYRLPFCSAFLRPTNRVHPSHSKLVSTGIHVPVCMVRDIANSEKKITKKNTRERSLSNKVFEELFHQNLVGSRWISLDELERFYQEKSLFSHTSIVRVHAQEVIKATEEEQSNRTK